MPNSKFTVFLFFSFFEAITIPLYFRLLYVLFKRPKFSTPFYRFLIVNGFTNILNYSLVEVFAILPIFNVSLSEYFAKTLPPNIFGPILFTTFYTSYQQDLLHLSMSLNRFTCVFFPFIHEKHWKKYWLWHIFGSFGLTFPLAFHNLFVQYKFGLVDANDTSKGWIPIAVGYSFYSLDSSLVTTLLNGICLLICVTLNTATIIKIIGIRKNSSKILGKITTVSPASQNNVNLNGKLGIQQQQQPNVELNLFIVALVMTFMLIVSMVHQFLFYFIRTELAAQLFGPKIAFDGTYELLLQMPWVNDLHMLSQPWVLVAVSEDIRREIIIRPFLRLFNRLKLMLGKNGQHQNAIPISTLIPQSMSTQMKMKLMMGQNWRKL